MFIVTSFFRKYLNLLISLVHLMYSSITDVVKKLQEYVDDINANIEKLDTRGPVSKYTLPDENLRGRCG